MIFGRFIGWLLVAAALVVASGEAIAALGTGTRDYIATRDLWALLLGKIPEIADSAPFKELALQIMQWPAWVAAGAIGLFLLLLCRPRTRRSRGYRFHNPI
jgi:hypothetical protein